MVFEPNPEVDCSPPLAIANRYQDRHSHETKCIRYRLILVHSSYATTKELQSMMAKPGGCHGKTYPFKKLYYLPMLRIAHLVRIPNQEVTPLPGIFFFDAWRIEPCCEVPTDLPNAHSGPEESNLLSPPGSPRTDQAKAKEEEARDILARASKNQADDGPSTRKAAIRAYRYLRAMVIQHSALIQQAYDAAREHATRSKGPIDTKDAAGYRPLPGELPTIPPELTSGLLHCLSTRLPDPWPLAKITINMDSASQWVSKMGRLFFADELVRHAPDTHWTATTPAGDCPTRCKASVASTGITGH